jgi:hypothetical protein
MPPTPDLRDTLLKFLEDLPDTIRTEVLLLVVAYAVQPEPLPEEVDFLPSIREYLWQQNLVFAAGAVICVTAVLDHVLPAFVRSTARRKQRRTV